MLACIATSSALAGPVLHEPTDAQATDAPMPFLVGQIAALTSPALSWRPGIDLPVTDAGALGSTAPTGWTVPAGPLVPRSPPAWTPFSRSAGPSDAPPTDPLPYALLGGLLLIAGLAARHGRSGQRGLSKKT